MLRRPHIHPCLVSSSLLLVLVLAFAGDLQAKVYYVNQGVRYHIGDNIFDRSEDAMFVGAYPVVGTQWVQAFTVSARDTVKVHIDHIWGVDDCPYCKDLVSIDTHDMGRLTAENNHTPFDTLEPLAYPVEPGKIYYLKILSYGLHNEYDDFVVEGVSVESQGAEVTFLQPGPVLKNEGQPMPKVAPAPALLSPCDGASRVASWLPEECRASSVWNLEGASLKDAAQGLAEGDYLEMYVQLVKPGAQGDRVSQDFEVLLGDPGSGWVISFPPDGASPSHGNVKVRGRYTGKSFATTAWQAGLWNQVRLARCLDGQARLWLNGRELAQSLEHLPQGKMALKFRAPGLAIRLAEKPL